MCSRSCGYHPTLQKECQGCQLSFMVENCKHFDILPTGKVGNSGKSKKKKKKEAFCCYSKAKKKSLQMLSNNLATLTLCHCIGSLLCHYSTSIVIHTKCGGLPQTVARVFRSPTLILKDSFYNFFLFFSTDDQHLYFFSQLSVVCNMYTDAGLPGRQSRKKRPNSGPIKPNIK